jgi:hypothetical protein
VSDMGSLLYYTALKGRGLIASALLVALFTNVLEGEFSEVWHWCLAYF